jgi:hypothetical protein
MNHEESVEALKVVDVDGQQMGDAMNVHARGEAGVMDLHALDFVRDQKLTPTIMHVATVRQKLKIALDDAGDTIRLHNAQPKPSLIERPG